MSKSCNNCYYGEECAQMNICSNYMPITEEAEDELLYDQIEDGRSEYHSAWAKYIEEFYN